MKHLIAPFFATLCLLMTHTTSTAREFGYRNPVISGMSPDPSVCRVGDDFYLVNSSFLHNPGLPLYHSKDLIHWELINHCIAEDNGLDLSKGCGLFAPTIRYDARNKLFYVICTNVGNGGNFICHAKNPTDAWSNPVWITDSAVGCIDPSLLFDTDGKCYYTGSYDGGIIQCEINPQTGETLSDVRMIWTGTRGRYPEGPHLYHTNNRYYLIISEGGTEFGHHIVAAQSNNPWGPFETCPYNPILSHADQITQENPIQCTGHGDLIDAPDGSWWMLFPATRSSGEPTYHLGSETFLAPVKWSRDFWPIVNGNGTVDEEMKVPTLPQQEAAPEYMRYEFDEDRLPFLPFNWKWYRHPVHAYYIVGDGPLKLLSDKDDPSFAGFRQQHFGFAANAKISYVPQKENASAGIAVMHDDLQGYQVGIIRIEGKRYIQSRCRFGQVDQTVREEIPAASDLYLQIAATKEMYFFRYSLDGKNWSGLGQMDARFLSGGFSGLLIGCYAEGDNRNSPASFDYIEYIPNQ